MLRRLIFTVQLKHMKKQTLNQFLTDENIHDEQSRKKIRRILKAHIGNIEKQKQLERLVQYSKYLVNELLVFFPDGK